MASDRKAKELLAEGRNAYYANRMAAAVELFRQAHDCAASDQVAAEALLELAPALSKSGRPEEALELLETGASLDLSRHQQGIVRHKRSLVLYELGRLLEAIEEMKGALELLADSGDRFTQAGVLVNLGAATSTLGRLDEAESWYRKAREQAVAASLSIQVAAIDGNLGYVASRRGRFAEALSWYEQGRSGFRQVEAGGAQEGSAPGHSGLLLAVLEIDHAQTLLDVGLVLEAVEVSEAAAEAARSGGNRMMETQALILGAEARLRAGDLRTGSPLLNEAAVAARELSQNQLALWAGYLAETLLPVEHRGDLVEDDDEDIARFVEAGWYREAHACALERARLHLRSDRRRAERLLGRIADWEELVELDPTARMVGRLLQADLAHDSGAATEALRQGLNRTAEQQALVGSLELWWSLDSRVVSLQNAALSHALRQADPARAILRVLEWTREVCYTRERPDGAGHRSSASPDREGPPTEVGADGWADDLMARARAARVALAEARRSGGDVGAAYQKLLGVEREVLRSHRTEVGSGRRAVSDVADIAQPTLPADVVGVTYIAIEGTLYGLRQLGSETTLVELGDPAPITASLRSQRTRLRRLADERRPTVDSNQVALDRVNRELDRLLIEPLELPDGLALVVAPTIRLRDVAWAALPSLTQRPITVTSSFTRWLQAPQRLVVDSAAALEGSDLNTAGTEVEAVRAAWPAAEVLRQASCRDAMEAFARKGMVHVAAHGTLRPDNAFFSAVEFSDGPLTLLDMVRLARLPSVMVLASCDAAAGVDAGQDAAVSTVNELRNHGVEVVIAPLVAVNDRAAADYSACLHPLLAAGESIDRAALQARRTLLESDDPRRAATALAFTVFGGRSTAQALHVSSGG